MANFCRWIVALGIILFILRVLSYVHPNFAYFLLSGLVLVALVVLLAMALVMGFLKWRKSSNFWLLPGPSLYCLYLVLVLCRFPNRAVYNRQNV